MKWIRALLASALLFVSSGVLHAASKTWTGTTSTDFTVGGNWGGTAPANDITTDTGLFIGTVTANQPALAGARSITSLDFQTASGGWTLSGAGTLTLGTAGISSTLQTSGINTLSVANIIMGATATSTWNIGASAGAVANTFNISSSIALNSTAQLILNARAATGTTLQSTVNLSGAITGTSAGGLELTGGNYQRSLYVFSDSGDNSSYNGPTLITFCAVTFNNLANAGANSSFGANGTVQFGSGTSATPMTYAGPGGQTDRLWVSGSTGNSTIFNNGNGV
jgi:fibronectin-binding autotransporter adhesin